MVVKKGGTEESCEGCSQGWSYQCDECDYAAVKREELKSHVEAVHRDGVINVTSVIIKKNKCI